MTAVWRACHSGPTQQGQTTRQQIVDAVVAQPGITMAQIATTTGLTYSQVRKQCPQLTSEGQLRVSWNGRRKHYSPVGRGRA